MSQTNSPKKQPLKDWHRAHIVAYLRIAGWSLRKLSVQHGKDPNWLKHALDGNTTKGEKVIADTLGIHAETIWPERFEKRRQKALKQQSSRRPN